MGVVSQDLVDQWEQHQRDMERQQKKHTIIKLPCCGTSIELERPEDQYITCPNRVCGKRHFLAWSLKPKLQSEQTIVL